MKPGYPEASDKQSEFYAISTLLRRTGREVESAVTGRSMEPTIPSGARIKIASVSPDDFKTGQVVVCAIGRSMFVHRIVFYGRVGRTGPFVLTQGDGNVLCDCPVEPSAVFGKVTEYLSGDGWQVPLTSASRAPFLQAVAKSHEWMIRACLALNYRLAVIFARTCWAGTSAIKRLLARLAYFLIAARN